MTAVDGLSGAGVRLTCDGCGTTVPVQGRGLHEADDVRAAVAAAGWTGSPFARGPHRCTACVTGATAPQPEDTTEAPAGVVITTTDAAAVVRVAGNVDLDAVADLRAALDEAMTLRANVIVDLSAAATIDTMSLGALIRARNAARRDGGDLLLAGPSRFLRTVLRMSRLDQAFRVFDTLPQAITATQGGRTAVPRRRTAPGGRRTPAS